jgi:endonuclease/exonuclease/phosphatase family metal-dependent hydrolase
MGDLSAIMPGQANIQLVSDGVLSSFASLAESQSAPEDMNSLGMTIKRTDGTAAVPFTYNISATTSTPTVMKAPVLTISTGNVPLTDTPFTVSMDCAGPGSARFDVSFAFSYDGVQCSAFKLSLQKTCTTSGGTCTNAVGYTYTPPTTTEPAAAPKAVTIVSYNTHGVERISATRAEAIAAKLDATGAAVVCLQEVFYSDDAALMTRALGTAFKYKAGSAYSGLPKLTSSGLLFASRFPIVKCSFEEYTAASGLDATATKGVSALLLDVGQGRMLYVFNSHLQAGGDSAVRASQLAQARAYVGTMLAEARAGGAGTPHGHGIPAENIGVVLVGDMNVRAGYEADAAGEYASMMVAMRGGAAAAAAGTTEVVDWTARTGVGYDSTPPPMVGGVVDWASLNFTRLNESGVCDAGAAAACSADLSYGSQMAFTTLDYAFGFGRLDGARLAPLAVTGVSKTAFCCTKAGGQVSLSDHAAVVVTVVHNGTVSLVATPPPTPAGFWDKAVPLRDTADKGATSTAAAGAGPAGAAPLAALLAVGLDLLARRLH